MIDPLTLNNCSLKAGEKLTMIVCNDGDNPMFFKGHDIDPNELPVSVDSTVLLINVEKIFDVRRTYKLEEQK
jgi:hypothetical protein